MCFSTLLSILDLDKGEFVHASYCGILDAWDFFAENIYDKVQGPTLLDVFLAEIKEYVHVFTELYKQVMLNKQTD